MQQVEIQSETIKRVPHARYAYYRRCQVWRRNGEQCKAPAEKGADICHAHAAQRVTAVRRARGLRAVLVQAAARMRERGRPEFTVSDIFLDFGAIQVTIAVMARALIDGTIDCKTAGRLAVGLQTASRLLWMHRTVSQGRQGRQRLPQVSADQARLEKENRLIKVNASAGQRPDGSRTRDFASTVRHAIPANINMRQGAKVAVIGRWEKVEQANGPPEWRRAA